MQDNYAAEFYLWTQGSRWQIQQAPPNCTSTKTGQVSGEILDSCNFNLEGTVEVLGTLSGMAEQMRGNKSFGKHRAGQGIGNALATPISSSDETGVSQEAICIKTATYIENVCVASCVLYYRI